MRDGVGKAKKPAAGPSGTQLLVGALVASLLFLWAACVIRSPPCCGIDRAANRGGNASLSPSSSEQQAAWGRAQGDALDGERRSTELEERFSGLGPTRDLYRSPSVA